MHLPPPQKQLAFDHKGQGLVEYTMIVLLVTMVFWVGVRDTDVGQNLQSAWKEVGGSILPVGGGSAGKPGEGSGGGSGGSSGSGSGSGSEGGTSGGSGSGSGGTSGSGSGVGSGGNSGSGSNGGGSSGGSGARSGKSGSGSEWWLKERLRWLVVRAVALVAAHRAVLREAVLALVRVAALVVVHRRSVVGRSGGGFGALRAQAVAPGADRTVVQVAAQAAPAPALVLLAAALLAVRVVAQAEAPVVACSWFGQRCSKWRLRWWLCRRFGWRLGRRLRRYS